MCIVDDMILDEYHNNNNNNKVKINTNLCRNIGETIIYLITTNINNVDAYYTIQ